MRAIRGIRNAPRRFFELDNLILLLIGIFIGLLLTVGAPRLIPEFSTRVDCTSLAQPLGEDHRSLLALSGDDPQNLELGIRVEPENPELGGTMEVEVIFRNEDRGPIILWFPEAEIVPVTGQPAFGIMLEAINPRTAQSWWMGYPAGVPRPQTYPTRDLYLLRSHEQCAMRYEITAGELEPLRSTQGEFVIRALYANNQPGVPVDTVRFATQGVWTGAEPAQSDEVRFQVVLPPAPTVGG